jgi:hypothetical protein
VREPIATFAVNVMGTAHLLDALRTTHELRAVLVVTADKVNANPQSGRPFREGNPLGGHDPYAASKAAAEIVISSFARTYFEPGSIAIDTARSNVIGGGNFAEDRIVPDIYRAMVGGHEHVLRHPAATRPWQHVLDCLTGYRVYARGLYATAFGQRHSIPRALNFGPSAEAEVPVSALAAAMQTALGAKPGWCIAEHSESPEMETLALDSALARQSLAGAIVWSAKPPFGPPAPSRRIQSFCDSSAIRYQNSLNACGMVRKSASILFDSRIYPRHADSHMTTPRLSICVPTFKREALLRETLTHLREVCDDDTEIVISDNCSPDGTQDVIKSFADRFRHFRAIRQTENRGAINNCAAVISVARGRYLYLLCDDDRILPQGLQSAIATMEHNASIVAVFGGYQEWNRSTGQH